MKTKIIGLIIENENGVFTVGFLRSNLRAKFYSSFNGHLVNKLMMALAKRLINGSWVLGNFSFKVVAHDDTFDTI